MIVNYLLRNVLEIIGHRVDMNEKIFFTLSRKKNYLSHNNVVQQAPPGMEISGGKRVLGGGYGYFWNYTLYIPIHC